VLELVLQKLQDLSPQKPFSNLPGVVWKEVLEATGSILEGFLNQFLKESEDY
jgi:hypothetical protein